MNLAGIVGKSVRLANSYRPRPGIATALTVGAGAYGFNRGLGSQDISSGAYEALTGDPQIDQYVFGTDVGIRELLAPLPTDATSILRSSNVSTAQKVVTGVGSGLINSRTMTRHFAAQRSGYYDNRMPTVSGEIVFGSYNSRSR